MLPGPSSLRASCPTAVNIWSIVLRAIGPSVASIFGRSDCTKGVHLDLQTVSKTRTRREVRTITRLQYVVSAQYYPTEPWTKCCTLRFALRCRRCFSEHADLDKKAFILKKFGSRNGSALINWERDIRQKRATCVTWKDVLGSNLAKSEVGIRCGQGFPEFPSRSWALKKKSVQPIRITWNVLGTWGLLT